MSLDLMLWTALAPHPNDPVARAMDCIVLKADSSIWFFRSEPDNQGPGAHLPKRLSVPLQAEIWGKTISTRNDAYGEPLTYVRARDFYNLKGACPHNEAAYRFIENHRYRDDEELIIVLYWF